MLFDLDDTLYPPSSGIWDAVGDRMEKYMVEKLSIPEESAPAERKRLFNTHGTTLQGLIKEYQIDDLDFLDYVHDIPIHEFISEDPQLKTILASYPQRKVVFTNAHTGHAARVLSVLGVKDFFDQVIDIRSIKPWCKPQPEAFTSALEQADIRNPANCLLIDDNYRNLVTAHDFSMSTIQVGLDYPAEPVDAAILSLKDLPTVFSHDGKLVGSLIN